MPAKDRSIFKEPTVLIALIGLAGIIVTSIFAPLILKPTESPTATASSITPTPLPAGAEYAAQLLLEARQWTLVAKDSFDANTLSWPEGDTTDQSGEATRSIANGCYSWRVKANTESVNLWAAPSTNVTPDFYVAVDARNTKRLDIVAYAISFRHQGAKHHYDFMIYPNQYFSVHYKGQDQTSTTTLANLQNQIILPSESNRIAVIGIGSQFWFYINGVFVDYLTDDRIPTGSYGLGVSVKDVGDEGFIEFDNFELRKVP
jgi:hypothetical protein